MEVLSDLIRDLSDICIFVGLSDGGAYLPSFTIFAYNTPSLSHSPIERIPQQN